MHIHHVSFLYYILEADRCPTRIMHRVPSPGTRDVFCYVTSQPTRPTMLQKDYPKVKVDAMSLHSLRINMLMKGPSSFKYKYLQNLVQG
ncbi:hypothetical protein J6590_100797 [Homalodisca vitripennis]|nr:hypothetical protein J6590_100797 [Homalodisca vitripennis]